MTIPGRSVLAASRPRLGAASLTVLVAVFIVAFDNGVFWQHMADAADFSDPAHIGFAVAVAVFLICALSCLMSVFTWWFVAKPFLIGMLLLASTVAYFMTTYGVVIDDTMIANIAATDRGEAAGLFNQSLVWHIALTGVAPALLVAWVRMRYRRLPRELAAHTAFTLAMLVIALVALAVQYKNFALVLRQHRELRMLITPTYAIYSAGKYLNNTAAAQHVALRRIGEHAKRTPAAGARSRRKVMILVVGETTRAADWGLNGYSRDTTPGLAARDVLDFTRAFSCGTSTAVSVPCMFSPRGRDDFDQYAARRSENLLDVLAHAGVAVRWEENQAGGCKGVCARVPTQDMRALNIPGVCGPDYCHDAVFLHGLRDKIAKSRGDLLIVMHTMGSHGPAYYRRYPKKFARYTPECRSNRPQECSQAEIVNSYDNTVVYVDHVLSALIDVLKNAAPGADTALVYVSDHGESLGGHGIYLHGFPYLIAPKVQTHIPMIAWFSPGFRRASGLGKACVEALGDDPVGQDNLFATVLGLMDVTAGVYDRDQDIFAGCRERNDPPPAAAGRRRAAG